MNTRNINHIEPAFISKSIAIAATSSKEYTPYMAVWLQSIVDHTNTKDNYDIVIFERDIAEYDKIILKRNYSRSNISIRFFNPTSYFKTDTLYISHPYFKEECYYRLAAPLIFRKYERLIFTDIDLIFLEDPHHLHSINMGDAIIAASEELILKEAKANKFVFLGHNMAQYLQEVIGLSGTAPYYNTGVLVINIPPFIKGNYFNTLMKAIESYNFIYQEQCALNVVLQGKIQSLPTRWNTPNILSSLKDSLYKHDFEKYLDELNNIYIAHYLGPQKPWIDKNVFLAQLWWMYARRTPYYEQILERYPLTKRKSSIYAHFKYISYGMLALLSFGNRKNKFYKRHLHYKTIIKQITNKHV